MPVAAATGLHRVVNLARVSSGLWAADCYAHLASVLSSALRPASGNPGRPHTQVLRVVLMSPCSAITARITLGRSGPGYCPFVYLR